MLCKQHSINHIIVLLYCIAIDQCVIPEDVERCLVHWWTATRW